MKSFPTKDEDILQSYGQLRYCGTDTKINILVKKNSIKSQEIE